MSGVGYEPFPPIPKTFFFYRLHPIGNFNRVQAVKKKVFGSNQNRSPSIARMVRDIQTSVYSSPKAFRSFQSDNIAFSIVCIPPGFLPAGFTSFED